MNANRVRNPPNEVDVSATSLFNFLKKSKERIPILIKLLNFVWTHN